MPQSGAVVALMLLLTLAGAGPVPARPDPNLTPGVVRPITMKTVCTTVWGKDVRHVTHAMKQHVCAAYGAKACPGPTWILDHLIPRELAGADEEKNIWPQPIAEARLKDRLETALHRAVCTGQLTLPDAQQRIRQDWYAEYLKRFGAPGAGH